MGDAGIRDAHPSLRGLHALIAPNAGSPCVGVCRLDEHGVYCVGCLRTLSEIAAWSKLTEIEKSHILSDLRQRRVIQSRDIEPMQRP